MFDHLLESSHNKWSNIGFGEEMGSLGIKIRTLSGALNSPALAMPLSVVDVVGGGGRVRVVVFISSFPDNITAYII